MAWYKLALDAKAVSFDRGKKIAERLVGLEGPWSTLSDRNEWLGWESDEANLWSESLGTIGAGNHFAEIQVVGEVSEECELQQDDVVLLVHSGSRGYGGDILKRYSSTSLAEDSPEARAYLHEHDRACDWAIANRDLIALRIFQCLEPKTSDPAPPDLLRQMVQSRKLVDIVHNNMQQVHHAETNVWIHRKGAAPTRDPTSGDLLPLLPLPGSRATPTAILRPLTEQEPMRNAQSVAHGAGRAMTRAKALQSLPGKYDHDTKRLLVPQAGEGTWVVCEDKELVWEEAPEAYKDIRAVASDLASAGLVNVLGWSHPRVSYKVRR
ncbi:hypothetical protein IAU60_002551 [Kwoniella sp. DSM 27419]